MEEYLSYCRNSAMEPTKVRKPEADRLKSVVDYQNSLRTVSRFHADSLPVTIFVVATVKISSC